MHLSRPALRPSYTVSDATASTDIANSPTDFVPSSPSAPERRAYDRSIVEGPLRPAGCNLASPTMLTRIIGGLQGIVDHFLVRPLVGFKRNAAIGVSMQ